MIDNNHVKDYHKNDDDNDNQKKVDDQKSGKDKRDEGNLKHEARRGGMP
jgi:hypothetical protein